MSVESISPSGSVDPSQQAGIVDPSAQAGIVDPYEQNKRAIDPSIARLAADPASFQNPAERDAALAQAQHETAVDMMKNKVILESGGNKVWGNEYPNAFAFDGGIRGKFDRVPKDPTKWTPKMQLGTMNMEGKHTHVIIDMDDGERIFIRRTSGDTKSAELQTFDVVRMGGSANVGKSVERKAMPSSMLKGVVAVPGERMYVNDPNDGHPLFTRGRVARITGYNPNDVVDANHPWIKRGEGLRSTVQERQPLSPAVLQGLGGTAVDHS